MSENKKRSLYEVAVLHHNKEGTTEVVKPQSLLAASAETARLAVVRLIPEDYDDKLDELEVIIRPFQQHR